MQRLCYIHYVSPCINDVSPYIHNVLPYINDVSLYIRNVLPYWRGKAKVVQKYSCCGVGILPAPDGLDAHPTREF
jgi:hypothetical protein